MMHKLFNECQLVHADLSEYNILWHEDQCWFIDVSQAVEPTHPHGLEFLYRGKLNFLRCGLYNSTDQLCSCCSDCTNMSNFFRRMGAKDAKTPAELFSYVSGFSVDGLEADVLAQIRDFERNEENLTVMCDQKAYPFDYCWEKSQETREEQVQE